jgi:hypothetical protein
MMVMPAAASTRLPACLPRGENFAARSWLPFEAKEACAELQNEELVCCLHPSRMATVSTVND